MSVAMIGPKFYAWDRNGKPLAFGKLYTYQSKTNIPKITYTSEDKAAENTNPVILNGEGYADIYLSGQYKMVLKDDDENEIWSSDPVSENVAYEWVNCMTAVYVSPLEFKVTGNFISIFDKNRKVRLNDGTPTFSYAKITGSVYAGGETTVTIDQSVVSINLEEVCTSIVSYDSSFGPDDVGDISLYVFDSEEAMISNDDDLTYKLDIKLKIQGEDDSFRNFIIVDALSDIDLGNGLWAKELMPISPEKTIKWDVGNDANAGPYDYPDLIDALLAANSLNLRSKNNGQMSIQITIPAGDHTFSFVNLRGMDLSNVQVWGYGARVVCELDGVTSGTWFKAVFCKLGDFAGTEYSPSPNVTVSDDPNIVCQRWYGAGVDPSGPAMTLFNFQGCIVERVIGGFTGSSNPLKVLNGGAFLIEHSIVHIIDEFYVRQAKVGLVAYNASNVFVGYGGLRCTNVYQTIINHGSNVEVRAVRATAFNTTDVPRPGSIFVDTFRGKTTLWQRASDTADLIRRFDTLFYLSGGEVICEIAEVQFAVFGKVLEQFGSGNRLVSEFKDIETSSLFADSIIGYVQVSQDAITPITRQRIDLITYSGNDANSRLIVAEPNLIKCTVTNKTTGQSTVAIRDHIIEIGGLTSLWFDGNEIKVYPPLNALGTDYELIWERA